MQALVTYPYRDRESLELRLVGETVELSAERFRELSLKGFVAEPAEQVEEASEMTVAELRSAIEAKGGFAPKKATKDQLISILRSL